MSFSYLRVPPFLFISSRCSISECIIANENFLTRTLQAIYLGRSESRRCAIRSALEWPSCDYPRSSSTPIYFRSRRSRSSGGQVETRCCSCSIYTYTEITLLGLIPSPIQPNVFRVFLFRLPFRFLSIRIRTSRLHPTFSFSPYSTPLLSAGRVFSGGFTHRIPSHRSS